MTAIVSCAFWIGYVQTGARPKTSNALAPNVIGWVAQTDGRIARLPVFWRRLSQVLKRKMIGALVLDRHGKTLRCFCISARSTSRHQRLLWVVNGPSALQRPIGRFSKRCSRQQRARNDGLEGEGPVPGHRRSNHAGISFQPAALIEPGRAKPTNEFAPPCPLELDAGEKLKLHCAAQSGIKAGSAPPPPRLPWRRRAGCLTPRRRVVLTARPAMRPPQNQPCPWCPPRC